MNTKNCTPVLSVRISREPSDIRAALACRAQAFGPWCNEDKFDNEWLHILIKNTQTGRVVGCARIINHAANSDLHQGYSGQFYDLSRLNGLGQPMLELGRFCVLPGTHSVDAIRLIWTAVAQMTDHYGSKMLVGCSSFMGIDPSNYTDAFALLGANHMAPDRWAPSAKSEDIVALPKLDLSPKSSINGLRQLPPLIRSYLAMGGWVSDHGIIDRQMSTIHVFTGLEVAKIPARRAARLRNLAA